VSTQRGARRNGYDGHRILKKNTIYYTANCYGEGGDVKKEKTRTGGGWGKDGVKKTKNLLSFVDWPLPGGDVLGRSSKGGMPNHGKNPFIMVKNKEVDFLGEMWGGREGDGTGLSRGVGWPHQL